MSLATRHGAQVRTVLADRGTMASRIARALRAAAAAVKHPVGGSMIGFPVVALMVLLLPLTVAAAAVRPPVTVRAMARATVLAAGVSMVLTPADAGRLKVRMQALRAGDTLLLAPGRYDIGGITVFAHPGTARARITVAAQDPAHPPLLQGLLRFSVPSYWVITGLRVQATVPGEEAMSINGGTGWIVSHSEFFGASSTGGYSNVTIDAVSTPAPRDFRFTANCVHDAGHTYPADPNRRQMDHNMYVDFPGDASSGGLIDHNLIFNHPNGAGIKLGDGGQPGALGPWGVVVSHNTIVEGGRQILLHGNVRYNRIEYNLLTTSRAPFTRSPKTTAIYVSMPTTTTNGFGHNYFWHEDLTEYDPANRFYDGGHNVLGANPGYTHVASCTGWQTTNPAAASYGRWS